MGELRREHGCKKGHFWYAVVGDRGAIHFHFWPAHRRFAEEEWAGGIEIHESVPASDAGHTDCWLLKGPCRHDGSSLWAQEYWIPSFMDGGTDWLWPRLEREYAERFPLPSPDGRADRPNIDASHPDGGRDHGE